MNSLMKTADMKKLKDWPLIEQALNQAVDETSAAFPMCNVGLHDTGDKLQIVIDGSPAVNVELRDTGNKLQIVVNGSPELEIAAHSIH